MEEKGGIVATVTGATAVGTLGAVQPELLMVPVAFHSRAGARVLGALNRGMRAVAVGFRHRGLGYLVVLTLLVSLIGAAAMYRFELDAPGGDP